MRACVRQYSVCVRELWTTEYYLERENGDVWGGGGGEKEGEREREN